MINFDDVTKEHNLIWPQLSDHTYGILLVGGSGSGKTNAVFNLISQMLDINKIYLYAKHPYKTKYLLLINKREGSGLKHFNESKGFIDYSSDMGDMGHIENVKY